MTPEEMLARFGSTEPFSPVAHYDADGDCLEFFVSNEPFKARRLDRWVTVYYGRESEDVVGSNIKDLRRLLTEYPGLEIDIQGGKVHLSHILRAPAWSTGDPLIRKVYQTVIEKADRSAVVADLVLSAN